jgi:hypothetical protein
MVIPRGYGAAVPELVRRRCLESGVDGRIWTVDARWTAGIRFPIPFQVNRCVVSDLDLMDAKRSYSLNRCYRRSPIQRPW